MTFRISKANESEEIVYADSGINYTESVGNINNPGRGFYKAVSHILNVSGANPPTSFSVASLQGYKTQGHNIIHLRLGLEQFSSNAYYRSGGSYAKGTTKSLTQDALDCLNAIFENIRQADQTAIIRFSYNSAGLSEKTVGIGEGSYINAEPPLQTILEHVTQLKPIFEENVDVIQLVEIGLLGPWGEMHTTAMAKDFKNSTAIINTMLAAVPESRCIAARNPRVYYEWYNSTFKTSYDEETMQNIVADPFTPEGRVGLFNDGYLGNSSDLGTFRSGRAAATAWIAKQTVFSHYGGEVVTDNASKNNGINDYNKIEFIAWEGFITHTSYLNIDWNNNVVAEWKKTPYRVAPLENSHPNAGLSATPDTLYGGANATAFDYVRDRLGYRLVLRDAKNIAEAPAGNKFYFKGKIENVGFGNVINEKSVTVIFKSKDGNTVYRQPLAVDPRLWYSSAGVLDLDFSLNLRGEGKNYKTGDYEVYLKINDPLEKQEYKESGFRSIRFANDDDIWDAELGANRIGAVTVTTPSEMYSVSFLDDDETTVIHTVNVSGGAELTSADLPENPPPRQNEDVRYEFEGWVGFSEGMVINEATVFIAAYKPIMMFTVTFDLSGGTLKQGTLVQKIDFGESAEPPAAEREGYDFAGWDSENYKNVSFSSVIKAKWKLKTVNPGDTETEPPADSGCLSSLRPVHALALLSGIPLFYIKRRI